MHSQLLPTIASHPGGGYLGDDGFSDKVNLDLGIGNGRGNEVEKDDEGVLPHFTASQFDEFFSQLVAYNRMISGLPVLFLPTSIVFIPENSSSKMECESGRCKRTDGRKWRCSRNVVPNQKYCERHMHRGRTGSRKHVESEIGMAALVTPGLDKDPSRLHCSCSNGAPVVVDCGALWAVGSHGFHKDDIKNNGVLVKKEDNLPSFGLSPTSVLHCGGGKVDQNVTEAQLQRCRRTDGKKWQCRWDAVAGQKYCKLHMHRGAKRIMLERSHRDGGINLNTMPASPQRISAGSNENSTATSSDATTITDENISFCHRRKC